MAFCIHCGANNPETALFCSSCGARQGSNPSSPHSAPPGTSSLTGGLLREKPRVPPVPPSGGPQTRGSLTGMLAEGLRVAAGGYARSAGEVIGDQSWRLVTPLGRGGMGEVWRVENRMGERGALKMMEATLSGDEAFVRRFQAEIKALQRVRHESVVSILNWGQDTRSGSWYTVMELIEGETLGARLQRSVLDGDEAKALLSALASGLAACHAAGVVHRDLKPANVMLRQSGPPALIDFGIALRAGESKGNTGMATIGYAAPEQLRGSSVGPAADLYSLGITLAESLGEHAAGRAPWRALIKQLTSNFTDERGTAEGLLAQLSGGEARYHVAEAGGAPEGPLSADEVSQRVLAGAGSLLLWWEGAEGWINWAEVEEVKARVDAVKPPPTRPQLTPPPPPPPPPAHSAGDRVIAQAQGQTFPFRFIPAGSFEMGSKKGVGHDDERPRHRVRITKPFLLGETPVTQAQWVAVMGNNPSYFKGDRRPVEKVSWFDCVRFCNKLSEAEGLRAVYQIGAGDEPEVGMDRSANGYRLPTEAEWEYAAKAGTELTYAGSNNLGEVGWYSENSGDETHPVGGKKANGWGLHDMSGNVWEWCSDEWVDDYTGRRSGVDDPISYRPGASMRVVRGGSWVGNAGICRVSFRNGSSPDVRDDYLGWRLSRSL